MKADVLRSDVTGLVLAGGQAKRLGGIDKGLAKYHGKTMISHLLETLEPELDHIIISANRNLEQYRELNHPVVIDDESNFAGPLAGIYIGLITADTPYVFTAPCDTPSLNAAVMQDLYKAVNDSSADLAVARVEEQIEPVIMVVRTNLSGSIKNYLDSGLRKTSDWVEQQDYVAVDFSDHAEWFKNINTEEDIA